MQKNIIWFRTEEKEAKIINEWMSETDKHFLCMENKNWQQTGSDIGDCLKYAPNGQFVNVFGIVDNTPVVAAMIGLENCGKVLNIYDIIVNPKYRKHGVGKLAIKDILKNKFYFNPTYKEVVSSVYPNNRAALKLFSDLGFKKSKIQDGLIVMSKPATKEFNIEL